MVMQLNVAHANLRKQKQFKGTQSKEEEENQNVVRKITVTKFSEQTRRKEQLENDKSGEKTTTKAKVWEGT